jgi:hypothetical protein
MSWSLFLPVFETANLLSGMVFWGGFFGMFCLFRASLLSAFRRCTGLGWPKIKRDDLRGEGFRLVAALSRPFGKLCSVYPLIFEP